MYPLKPLPREAVGAALEKAERYRLLNDPELAESICLDVLEVEPENQRARVVLLLSRTDQFAEAGSRVEPARALAADLADEYERHYYAGIVCERWGKALLGRSQPGSAALALRWLRQALGWYEKAERLRPPGQDDPVLRWNTCVRLIRSQGSAHADEEDPPSPLLLE
jgi:hypothetical protein